MQRLSRFGIAQTAKVLGVLYGLVGLVFIPFFILSMQFAPNKGGIGPGFALAIPVLYGLAGFIFTAIGCALYNLVAKYLGGIEVELETSPLSKTDTASARHTAP
ncbi:MAG TPA: hypothetical protein VK535_08965 [Gemmatimonadales bacterium]|nr:hypothetical protein [Gemmatimonadales bacterium]